MSFADKDDAKIWMIKHELEWKGRKITPAIRSHLALKMNTIISDRARANLSLGGGDRKSDEYKERSPLQNSVNPIIPVNTQKELAKMADVSHDTIAKMKVIEAEATPEQLKDVMESEKSINKVYQEIKGSKLKTPEHLMDKFEPEEVVYENSEKCPMGKTKCPQSHDKCDHWYSGGCNHEFDIGCKSGACSMPSIQKPNAVCPHCNHSLIIDYENWKVIK